MGPIFALVTLSAIASVTYRLAAYLGLKPPSLPLSLVTRKRLAQPLSNPLLPLDKLAPRLLLLLLSLAISPWLPQTLPNPSHRRLDSPHLRGSSICTLWTRKRAFSHAVENIRCANKRHKWSISLCRNPRHHLIPIQRQGRHKELGSVAVGAVWPLA